MKIHIVQKGDTLYKIAHQYHVDLETLIQLNPQISNPEMIMPGMKIQIPSETVQLKDERQGKHESESPKIHQEQTNIRKTRPMQNIHLDETETKKPVQQQKPQVNMNKKLKEVGEPRRVQPLSQEQMRPHTVVYYYCCCCKHHPKNMHEMEHHMEQPHHDNRSMQERYDMHQNEQEGNQHMNDTYFYPNGPFYHM